MFNKTIQRWNYCHACMQSDLIVVSFIFKFSYFLSSSPEPLGQFQTNLAQIIFELKEFEFVQIKGTCPFPLGFNSNIMIEGLVLFPWEIIATS